jgi:hypothetical protein
MSWDLHRKPGPFLRRELIAYMKLARACESWRPTESQVTTLHRYTCTGYEGINGALRGDQSRFDEWAGLRGMLDSLDGIETVACPEGIVVWRGVRLPADLAPIQGEIWTDEAFLSTSVSRRLAEHAIGRYRSHEGADIDYVPCLFEIHLDEAAPIIPVYWALIHDEDRYASCDPPARLVNEAEILLPAATDLRIDRVRTRADGVRVIACRVLPNVADAAIAA